MDFELHTNAECIRLRMYAYGIVGHLSLIFLAVVRSCFIYTHTHSHKGIPGENVSTLSAAQQLACSTAATTKTNLDCFKKRQQEHQVAEKTTLNIETVFIRA